MRPLCRSTGHACGRKKPRAQHARRHCPASSNRRRETRPHHSRGRGHRNPHACRAGKRRLQCDTHSLCHLAHHEPRGHTSSGSRETWRENVTLQVCFNRGGISRGCEIDRHSLRGEAHHELIGTWPKHHQEPGRHRQGLAHFPRRRPCRRRTRDCRGLCRLRLRDNHAHGAQRGRHPVLPACGTHPGRRRLPLLMAASTHERQCTEPSA